MRLRSRNAIPDAEGFHDAAVMRRVTQFAAVDYCEMSKVENILKSTIQLDDYDLEDDKDCEEVDVSNRNRLAQEKLNNMVYVKYNRALQRRHRKEGTTDPIELEDIDESNEWLMDRMEDDDDDLVFLGDDLTFNVVCKASGANEPIRLTRASKARATTDGSGPSRSDKGKKHALYDEDDEIEEDIGVLDGEGDGPMFGDNDTIDLDFY
ncbi:hypothetical protein E3N88_18418 [Mikania micrantha]|uniref:Uncharacterized protein n=1 Tax=Mikania micrantha TaxID=192012 RepID=A0A5N6NKF5_9ASTR|nr:hypothetical protein E3N88_18418 [Mikania micrantha]